jgi:transcriptional regulator with XRE-family HTH domain
MVTTALDPRQPRSLLGWTMREMRNSLGWGVTRTAVAFGCSASHITRVELGQARPSRDLLDFYEQQFEGDGLLPSLMETVEHHAEQHRRRAARSGSRIARAAPGDASDFIDSRLALGTMFAPGQAFSETCRIKNAGAVPGATGSSSAKGRALGRG